MNPKKGSIRHGGGLEDKHAQLKPTNSHNSVVESTDVMKMLFCAVTRLMLSLTQELPYHDLLVSMAIE